MTRVARTVVVRSIKLPRKAFEAFTELERLYRDVLEQLVFYAVENNVKSFVKLKALKYREMRSSYPQLPSHYVYTACQDASTRVKSFLRLKKLGIAEKERPEIKNVTLWLDDHLWRLDGLTSIKVSTTRGRVMVEFEPHKQYWKYLNGGWKLASEAKIKIDERERRLLIYLTFVKEVEEYSPAGYMSVDVNENNVTVLIEGNAYLFETDAEKLVLGYYYRRKKMQKKYDKLYGAKSRAKRRAMKKLKEKEKKEDIRWKVANIIVRTAREKHFAVVLEDLGKKPAENMIKKIGNKQLRHRIFQTSFRGIQRAIEEKAKEYGVPVIRVDPRNTSKVCPVHGSPIAYEEGSRIGKCTEKGELWHRDVVACWNLLIKALQGDGSDAPSPAGSLPLDGRAVPLPSTATHDPIRIPKSLWARWKSLPQEQFVTISNEKAR